MKMRQNDIYTYQAYIGICREYREPPKKTGPGIIYNLLCARFSYYIYIYNITKNIRGMRKKRESAKEKCAVRKIMSDDGVVANK